MTNWVHMEISIGRSGVRERHLTRLRRDGGGEPVEIFHEFERSGDPPGEILHDGHVLAVLLHLCAAGAPLRVHGPMSRTMLRNLEELQDMWTAWRPDVYRKIDIVPDRVVDVPDPAGEERAVAAFSGGVDSLFTMHRHTRLLPDPMRYPLHALMLVHGFDIDLDNVSGFARLAGRVEPVARDLGLELLTVRTNSKALQLRHWEDSFGFEIGACFHLFDGRFQVGLIGSGSPYNALHFPWGSSPAMDRFFSNAYLTVVHDGAGFSRTEKVAAIADDPVIRSALNVCWAGAEQGVNCGRCEKCIRTQLNFLAAGSEIPPCFPPGFAPSLIRSIPAASLVQRNELQRVAEAARARGTGGLWLPELDRRLADFARDDRNRQRWKAMVRTLEYAGVDRPARFAWRMAKRLFR